MRTFATCYPTLAAAAMQMDCSGGARFRTPEELERAAAAIAGQFCGAALRNADAELAGYNPDQLSWVAMGGMYTGDDYEGAGGEPIPAAGTERILEALYAAA